MKYRKIGRIKEELSVIGYGAWGISGAWGEQDNAQYIKTIHTALDQGINVIDTAPIYGFGSSEDLVGKAIKDRRSKVFLASKCGLVWNKKRQVKNNLSRSSLMQEIDQVLHRLQTDYIDLWQIHWPNHEYQLEESLEALAQIKKSGKIKYIGLCNFSLKELEQANSITEIASYQGLYNIFEQNVDRYHSTPLEYQAGTQILPYTLKQGMAFLPYSPLMQGLLSGAVKKETEFAHDDVRKHNPRLNGEKRTSYLEIVNDLDSIAADYHITMAQLSLLWLIHQKGITSIIAGARKESHVVSNAETAELQDDPAINLAINEILKKHKAKIDALN
jgi:aryl-alcohol dehydrogenase-like predicted oxidoreductase